METLEALLASQADGFGDFLSLDITNLITDGSPEGILGAWNAILNLGNGIHQVQYEYDLYEPYNGSEELNVVNSNSFAATIMNAFGVDLHTLVQQAISSDNDTGNPGSQPWHTNGAPGLDPQPTLFGIGLTDREIVASRNLEATHVETNVVTGEDIQTGYHMVGRDGVDDIIVATDYNDTLWADDLGDSNIGEGGADYLYGGKGDDRYVVDDNGPVGISDSDEARDIFAVGEGNDYISGRSDADNRIVLPTFLITPPNRVPRDPEDGNQYIYRGNGLGNTGSEKNGIALLGGIGGEAIGRWTANLHLDYLDELYFEDYSFAAIQPGQPGLPGYYEHPGSPPGTNDPQAWHAFQIEYYNLSYVQQHRLDILNKYQQLDRDYSDNSLFISVSYYGEKGWDEHLVLIEDFQNGDFGIQLFESPGPDGDVLRKQYRDYIFNDGNYIKIPDTSDAREVGPANPLRGGSNPDDLEGTDENEVLQGLEGDDSLSGGGGNDRLNGGEGADLLDGGEGTDTIIYRTSSVGVIIDLENGTASGGDAEGDQFSDVENVRGSSHDDQITGDGQQNRLAGGDGDDHLLGGAGDDRLKGGAGADQLNGGEGADWALYNYSFEEYYHDQIATGNTDILQDFPNVYLIDGVTIDLADGSASGLIANGDDLIDIENIRGSDFNDTLYGDEGKNVLVGGIGQDILHGRDGDDRLVGGLWNDMLYGGEGNDKLVGGSGIDILDGGSGTDWAIYTGSDEAVIIDLDEGTALGGDATEDILVSIENLRGSAHDDVLTGDHRNNRLEGLDGDDVLNGGDGNDTLVGGAGNDTLTGGAGSDRYVFKEGFGSDIITDFDVTFGAGDKINLKVFEIDDVDAFLDTITYDTEGARIAVEDEMILLANVEADMLEASHFIV